jgi:hypothetical protein
VDDSAKGVYSHRLCGEFIFPFSYG